MTALSAATWRTIEGRAEESEYDVAATTTIYKGSICLVDASGDAKPAFSSAANHTLKCVGVAVETVSNTGAAGAKTVRVRHDHLEHFTKAAAVTAGLVGDEVSATDDDTIGVAVTTATIAGILHRIEGSLAVVRVRRFLDGSA